MKHVAGVKNALLFATIFLSHTGLAVTAVHDNGPNCNCFLVSGKDRGYFQNHRFIDFRNIRPGPGEDFTQAPPLLADSDNQGNESVTSSYFNSATFTNDWFFLNGPAKQNGTVASVYSPRNIFIFKNTDAGVTYLALRAQRLSSFVSNAEVDTTIQNILYSSMRTRACLIPALTTSTAPQPYLNMDTSSIKGLNDSHPIAPGTVLGFFTYQNETQESDIEILTSDPVTNIRYSNQPDYNASTDQALPGASTYLTLQNNVDWTDWHEHRIDWYQGISRWYVDGSLMLEKTINVPTAPSALLLNLWSDGGNWSQDMSVGAQVVGAFQWIEMTYNVSGGNGGDKCFTGCNVDGVKVQGTPEKAFSSDGSRVLVGMMLRIVVVGVAWIWVG